MRGKAKVLVIEDNPQWANHLKGILEENGFLVKVATNAEQALKLLENEQFHFSTIDLQLDVNTLRDEEFEGWEILKKILSLNLKKSIKTMVLTGFPSVYNIKKALLGSGADYFMGKSEFDSEEFINRITININSLKVQFSDSTASFFPKVSKKKKVYKSIDSIVPDKIMSTLENYSTELKTVLNLTVQKMQKQSSNYDLYFQEIMECFQLLSDNHEVIKNYFFSIVNDKDGKFVENKLEIAIAIIPGVLRLKKIVDLDNFGKKFQDTFDKATFPVYEKLAQIYNTIIKS